LIYAYNEQSDSCSGLRVSCAGVVLKGLTQVPIRREQRTGVRLRKLLLKGNNGLKSSAEQGPNTNWRSIMGWKDLLSSKFDSRNTSDGSNKSDKRERHVGLPDLTV
jgi:hypothetical protein